jgi:hypothetical protein
LHSMPLQQKFTQTFLGRLTGKMSVILILEFWSHNIPMSVFWHVGVSFATVKCCFFWHWVWEGLALPLGMVGLCLSPALVRDAASLRAPRRLLSCPVCLWSREDASVAQLWQTLVLFQGDRV